MPKFKSILCISLCLLSYCMMFAQDKGFNKKQNPPDTTKTTSTTPPTTTFSKKDTNYKVTQITPPDTLKKDSVQVAQDTSAKDTTHKSSWLRTVANRYTILRFAKPRGDSLPDPKVTWRRAVILPGWGQAYNRRYWKIPIVYAAMGTFGYLSVNSQIKYSQYRKGYYYAVDDNETTKPSDVNPDFAYVSDAGLRSLRDQARRSRDQNVLYFGLMYGLQIAEAFIDSHLQGFDVSEDLSWKISPAPIFSQQTRQKNANLGLGLNIALRF